MADKVLCPVCQRRYQKVYLAKHKCRPFHFVEISCTECEAKFTQKWNLIRHFQVIHHKNWADLPLELLKTPREAKNRKACPTCGAMVVQLYLHKCKQAKAITNSDPAKMPVRHGAGNGPHTQVLKPLVPLPLLVVPLLPVVTAVTPVTVVPAAVVPLPVVKVATEVVVEEEADTSRCKFPLPGPSQSGERKQWAPKRFQAGFPSPLGRWSESDESDWSFSESTGTFSDSNTEDNGFLSARMPLHKAYKGKGKGVGKSSTKTIPAIGPMPKREGLRSDKGIKLVDPFAVAQSRSWDEVVTRIQKRAKRIRKVSDHSEALKSGRSISPLRLRQPSLVPKRSAMWKTVHHVPSAIKVKVCNALSMYATATISDSQVRYQIKSQTLCPILVTDLIRNSQDRTITEAINFIKSIYKINARCHANPKLD